MRGPQAQGTDPLKFEHLELRLLNCVAAFALRFLSSRTDFQPKGQTRSDVGHAARRCSSRLVISAEILPASTPQTTTRVEVTGTSKFQLITANCFRTTKRVERPAFRFSKIVAIIS